VLRSVAGIQARTGSTRLPRKVLADLGGKPLIQRVVERARAAERVDEVFVLTSVEASDDELAAALEELAIPYRRGPLDDVYARYLALVEELEPRFLVRITGDCPLIEPGFIDAQLAALEAHDGDFTWVERSGIDGTLGGQAALSTRAFLQARESDDPRDREHVASFWFQANRNRFRWVGLEVDPVYRREGLRLQVDEPSDLELLRTIFARFAPADGGHPSLAEVVRWLDEHPEVRAINERVDESADNRALRRLTREPEVPLVGRWP